MLMILLASANNEYPNVWCAGRRTTQDKEYSFQSSFTEKDAKTCTAAPEERQCRLIFQVHTEPVSSYKLGYDEYFPIIP